MRRWTGIVVGLLLSVSLYAAPVQAGGLVNYPSVTLSSNLITTNAGFETGDTTGWSCNDGWSVDGTVAHSGTYSMKLTDANIAAGAQACSYTLTLEAGKLYRLTGWMKLEGIGDTSGANDGVTLRLNGGSGSSSSTNCEANGCSFVPIQKGTLDWTYFELPYVAILNDTTTGKAILSSYSEPDGVAYFDDLAVYEEIPPPVEAFLKNPSYRGVLWDDNPEGKIARFWVQDNSCGAGVEAYIDGSTPDTAPTTTSITPGDDVGVSFTFTSGQIGFRCIGDGDPPTYPLYQIDWVDAATRDTYHLTWDHEDRFLVYGQKKFLIGMYDAGGGYSTGVDFWEQRHQDLTRLFDPTLGLDFDAYINYQLNNTDLQAILDMQTMLWGNHGVLWFHTGNCSGSSYRDGGTGTPGQNWKILNDASYGAAIGAHAGNAGAYTGDECDTIWAPYVFSDYQTLKARMPKGATLIINNKAPVLNKWTEAGDIVGTDAYPHFNTVDPDPRENESKVGLYAATSREANHGAKPFTMVLQYFPYSATGRFPTQAELRRMGIAAITEGAQGLWYWSLGVLGERYITGTGCSSTTWCDNKTTQRVKLQAVTNELNALEPILIANDDETSLERVLVDGVPQSGVRAGTVRALVRSNYVFAYSLSDTTVTATFDWFTGVESATVYGESRSITPVADRWSDTFDPHEAHIYQIVNGDVVNPPTPGAGDIQVRLQAVSETSATIRFGTAGLDFNTDCTAEIVKPSPVVGVTGWSTFGQVGLFNMDFEEGNLNDATGSSASTGNTIAASATNPKNGTYAARCTFGGTTDDCYVYKTVSDSPALYARAYVYLGGVTSMVDGRPVNLLSIGDGSTVTGLIQLYDRGTSYDYQVRHIGGSYLAGGTEGASLPAEWRRIELYSANGGGSGLDTLRAKIYKADGSLHWDSGNVTRTSVDTPQTRVVCGTHHYPGANAIPTGTLDIDECAASDTDWLGDEVGGGGPANVWFASLAAIPSDVTFDGVSGTEELTLGALNGVEEWYYDSTAKILYVYSTVDPDTAYVAPGVEVDASVAVDSVVSASGLAKRTVRFEGLTAGTLYQVNVTCTGYSAPEALGLTTLGSQTGNTTWPVYQKPHAILTDQGVDSVQVVCTRTDAAGSVTGTGGSCGTGCSVNLTDLVKGGHYSCVRKWCSDAGTCSAVVATSPAWDIAPK